MSYSDCSRILGQICQVKKFIFQLPHNFPRVAAPSRVVWTFLVILTRYFFCVFVFSPPKNVCKTSASPLMEVPSGLSQCAILMVLVLSHLLSATILLLRNTDSMLIINGKLNIQHVQPIESSVLDGSTHSCEVGTKPKTQQNAHRKVMKKSTYYLQCLQASIKKNLLVGSGTEIFLYFLLMPSLIQFFLLVLVLARYAVETCF